MKKFFDVVIAVKERAALNYTAAMCIYLFFLWAFQQEGASLSALFSLLLVGVMSGLVQVVAFSGLIIKKLAYGWRMVLFFVVFGAILTVFAVGFGWFPVENAWAWVSFGVAFLLIFAAIAGGIEIYYRASGRRWDDRLDWYRRNRDKK